MFLKVDIMGLNLNTNFEFFRQKSRELLSFEFEPSSFTRNSESNYVRIEGRKNGCLRFFLGFGDKILDIYLENNPHKIKFCEKKILWWLFYSRDFIALKICRKVAFGHSFDNNH